MAAPKVLKLDANGFTEHLSVSTSAGAGDVDKLVALNASGKVDATMLPAAYAEEITLPVGVDVNAGMFVNIYDDAGTTKVRPADNTSAANRAHGYVTATVTAGSSVTVYYGNTNLVAIGTGLTAGTVYLGDLAGQVTSTRPTASGSVIQILGTCFNPAGNDIVVEIDQSIITLV